MANTLVLSFRYLPIKLCNQAAFLRRSFLTDLKWSWFGLFEKLKSYFVMIQSKRIIINKLYNSRPNFLAVAGSFLTKLFVR